MAKRKGSKRRRKKSENSCEGMSEAMWRKERKNKHGEPIMCYGFSDEGICFSETTEEGANEVEALSAGSVEGKLWVRKHGTSWTQRPDIHVSVRQTSVGPEVIMEEADFKRLAEWAAKEHGRTGGTIQTVEPDPDPILKGTMEDDYASYCMGV